jgi:hypothetical protein
MRLVRLITYQTRIPLYINPDQVTMVFPSISGENTFVYTTDGKESTVVGEVTQVVQQLAQERT